MTIDPQELEKYYGLPPGLLSAQIDAESSGNPNAINTNTANGQPAIGLAQIQPATAKMLGVDPTDPDQSKVGMAMYDAQNLRRFGGDLPSALAAYNWGPTALEKNGLDKAPSETKDYIQKITSAMNPLGTAQAAEATPQANPYDNLSDEDLVAEAKKQGIQVAQPQDMQAAIGVQKDVPADQQVQMQLPNGTDLTDTQSPSNEAQQPAQNSYDSLSDEQLLNEAKKQGILPSDQKLTGISAFIPELKNSAVNAGEMASAGAKRFASGLEHPLSQAGNVPLGFGQSALGALGMAMSPVDAAINSFIANPVQNKTGIPAGLTNFVASVVTPYALGKGFGALAKLVPLFESAEPAVEAAEVTSKTVPETTANGGQSYNIFNDQGRQATANDALSSFASQPAVQATVSNVDTNPLEALRAFAQDATGTESGTSAIQPTDIPMTAGQSTQNPDLQRFESDALAGAKGGEAQAQANQFIQKQQQAVSGLLNDLGDFKPGGNPADSIGSVAKYLKSTNAAAENVVNKAWDTARDLGQDVVLGGKSNQFSSSGMSPNGISKDMQIGLKLPMDSIADKFAFESGDMNTANTLYNRLNKLITSPDGANLSDLVGWRRTATNLSKQGGSQGRAIGEMVGTYDNYMGSLAEKLASTGNQQAASAINAFKDAVSASRDYYGTFRSNDYVQDIIDGNKSVDDLTQDLLGKGNVGNKSGMFDNLNGILRASGSQAPQVRAQLQNAYTQKIYDTVVGPKLAGTETDSISLPKLQTALENIFVKNREFATGLYGTDATMNAQQVIKSLDLINSKQANVGNPSSSGYTLARLGLDKIKGLLSEIPGMGTIGDILGGLAHVGKEAKATKEAEQSFSGEIPDSFKPKSKIPSSLAKYGAVLGASSAVNRNQNR